MTLIQKREKNRIKNEKWRNENRSAYRQSAARYRRNHPDRTKNYRLRTKYGISIEEYYSLLKKQNGKCAICGNEETATHNFYKQKQDLAVDHCHKTGKIRGLLCQDCNRGIGKFHEDITILKNAIEYLQRTKKEGGDVSPPSCD